MVGGGAFVGDAFPRSSRAFWRVYFRSRRKSPPSICTDLPVPNVSHAIENQLEDDLHPPFLASSCRKATPLPFEQEAALAAAVPSVFVAWPTIRAAPKRHPDSAAETSHVQPSDRPNVDS